MKYLSIDIEATGLKSDDLIIEFAAIAFDTKTKKIHDELSFHSLVHCPSFKDLEPRLEEWVRTHNKELITRAHEKGVKLDLWKKNFEIFLKSKAIKDFFGDDKIVIFGKSLNAIDLPFLNRDLGWDWMRNYFSHRCVDFTGTCYSLMDLGMLPKDSERGSVIMKYLGLGDVAHNALDDAKNTAIMYCKVLEKLGK